MKQKDYFAENIADIKRISGQFKDICPHRGKGRLLILVYTPWNNREDIAAMTDTLADEFPDAPLAGMSVSGGIVDGKILLRQTVISFLYFEKSRALVHAFDMDEMTQEEAGLKFLSFAGRTPDLAGVGVFVTSITVNITDFVSLLSHLPKNVVVFGGGAMGEKTGTPGIVFTKTRLYERGIITFSIAGKIRMREDTALGWQALGQSFTITATDSDMVIQEIDGKPAAWIYEKYLKLKPGPEFGAGLLTFPLLLARNGNTLARLPAGSRPDGSLLMTASCYVGERVRLAYGDPQQIISDCEKVLIEIKRFRPEAVLAHTCVTRRLYLQKDSEKLAASYGEATSIAGGYTHGEISRVDNQVHIVNMTQVTVCMSEGPAPAGSEIEGQIHNFTLSESLTSLQRLATFVTTTYKELENTYRELKEANEKLDFAARHDGLSGLLNRAAIEKAMKQELIISGETKIPLSAIMLDLDNFKSINDTFGHERGDKVIRTIAGCIARNIKSSDYAGRWGGDEFVIILPRTDSREVFRVARHIRKTFMELPPLLDDHYATASFGCVSAVPGESMASFYKRMDAVLYKAKHAGKDTISIG